MTLLQRAVIQRLREGGYAALSTMAHEHWSKGEPVPGQAHHAEIEAQGLAADFIRANEQARVAVVED